MRERTPYGFARRIWYSSFALITRRRQPYGQSHASLPKKFDGRNSPTLKPKNFVFLKWRSADILAYFKIRHNKNRDFSVFKACGVLTLVSLNIA